MKIVKAIILIFMLLPVTLTASSLNSNNSQNKEIVELFNNYYAVRDKGDYEKAYKYLTVSTKKLISLDRWIEIAKKSESLLGKLKYRKIRKITWYNNPEGSRLPGIFAAVDFVGKTENANVYCGYLIWKKTKNGSFALQREEVNHISKRIERSLRKQGKLKEFKNKIGCKN